jgi:hypothetical protein
LKVLVPEHVLEFFVISVPSEMIVGLLPTGTCVVCAVFVLVPVLVVVCVSVAEPVPVYVLVVVHVAVPSPVEVTVP